VEYPVIVEQRNGVWRAVIPALSDLSAEGASRDEAMENAQRAAEDYLSKVEVTTIKVLLPREETLRPGSPQALLKEIQAFADDEEALREHFDEIIKERLRRGAKKLNCKTLFERSLSRLICRLTYGLCIERMLTEVK